ncbi:MAG TPA: MerR family transcriptional regulator [Planctomycetota bacterium]|nr:MerR family transcriptional regulator [Planctomycetota bacterium]
MGTWRTGQVIRNSRGVSRQQLYFYRVMGLIEPAGQTGSGRWLYDGRVFARLAEIAELRRRGKTLRQIREELSAGGAPLAQSQG